MKGSKHWPCRRSQSMLVASLVASLHVSSLHELVAEVMRLFSIRRSCDLTTKPLKTSHVDTCYCCCYIDKQHVPANS